MVLQVNVADGTHTATPTGVDQPQMVAVQLLAALAGTAVQPAGASVGPVVTTGQVVATHPLPAEAAAGAQDPVGVGPVVTVVQVVVV